MKKRFKIPLYLLSFFLLACVIFWVLLNQTSLLENQVNRLVNVWLQSRYDLRVKVGDVSGPFWKQLNITDVMVEVQQGNQSYTLARFPLITADYHLSNLWRKKWILDSLTIVSPMVSLKRDSKGKLLLPSPKGGKSKVISKTGLFDFRVGRLKIANGSFELASPGKALSLDTLGLEASLTKDREGIKIDLFQGDLVLPQKDFRLRNLQGSFRQREDSLIVDSLHVETDHSTLDFAGSVEDLKTKRFSFSVEAQPIDCQDIRSLTGVPLEGVLDLNGTVQGDPSRFGGNATLNGLFFRRRFESVQMSYAYRGEKLTFSSIRGRAFGSPIRGRGSFDFSVVPEEYDFTGELKNLDLSQIVFGSLKTDLSGQVSLQGSSTAEEEMFMQAEVNLQAGRIEQYTFSQAEGTLDITATAIRFHPRFLFGYKNTSVNLNGELEYSGDINVDAQVQLDDLADFRDQIFIKEMRGRGKAEVNLSGKTEDFNVKGEFTSDSCYVYELFSSDALVQVDVENFLTSEKGQAQIRFLDGQAWGVDYDSLVSRIKMDNHQYQIDSAWMGSDYLNVNLWGELDAARTPQTLIIYQMIISYQGNQLESSTPTVINIDTNRVEIGKWVLTAATGSVEASGTIDDQERMNLTVGLSEFDVAPWAGLLTTEPTEGLLSGETVLTGDFLNPEIEAKLQIHNFRFRDMRLGQLTADASYANKRLQVKDLSVTEHGWDYSFTGFVPLDLSFVYVEQRLLEEPQSLKMTARGNELELIRLFIPDIEYLTGDFEGQLNISGSLLHPQFEGQMTLRDGELKFAQLADPVRRLEADVRMKNENLILDQVSGIMERGSTRSRGILSRIWGIFSKEKKVNGTVNAFGTIDLTDVRKAKYNLYFNGENVPVDYEYADLTALANVDGQITGQSPPLVTANISLSELFYREPFSNTGSGGFAYSPEVAQELWDWNLDVSVTNNCWIINDDVNLEFKGNVLVLRDAGQLMILGNMETIRGSYFLYGTKFTIEKGSFYFDNLHRIDPTIDFLVSTNLWGGSSASSGGSSLLSGASSNKIELAIGGTLSEPEVKPASGSPYSSEDVIELLAFQRGLGSVDSAGVGSLFQERVLKSLGGAYSSRLLENIAGRSLGVETFEIVPTWSDKFRLTDAQITVGKYISDKVYLSYTRRLSQSSGQEAGVEYRLNKHLLLEGHRDKSGLFHLGLNLNWEY
jgi:autotransporter translocation and assembly factor TamB